MQRTSSMRSDTDVSTSGSQSLAKPGSTPLTNSEAPPSSAACLIGSVSSGGTVPSGYCRNTGLLDTTLMPAARNRFRSSIASTSRLSAIAVCTMQSGFSASSSSASLVASDAEVAVEPGELAGVLPDLGRDRRPTPRRARVQDGR